MDASTVTGLTTVNQLSGGDATREAHYIQMFLNMIPDQLGTANQALSTQKWHRRRNVVPRKSQPGFMEMKKGQELAELIQKQPMNKARPGKFPNGWIHLLPLATMHKQTSNHNYLNHQ